MSQPPGQYGGPFGPPGQPGRYGQPAPGQYGQPAPGQYGPPGGPGPGPGYGPGGPGGPSYGGPGGPPRKKSVLPWVITAAVVVLAGVGILLFFLLKDDDDSNDSSSAAASTSVAAQDMGSEMGDGDAPLVTDLPTGAEVPMDRPSGSGADTGEETISGSVELGAQWLVAVAQSDTATAWALTDPSLQDAATSAAADAGVSPQEYLVGYVFTNVFEGEQPTDASLVTVEYDDASEADVVVIDVTLASGGSVQVGVFVNDGLLVQDFGTL